VLDEFFHHNPGFVTVNKQRITRRKSKAHKQDQQEAKERKSVTPPGTKSKKMLADVEMKDESK
jgi:hypothetical protein